jgi:predicted pyridoxine 5'-phosphate oxidase superfamily flavin-nucleotide-binding protein
VDEPSGSEAAGRPGKTPASDVAFTPTVKAIQARKGSREAYARMDAHGGWSTTVDDELAAFIAAQTSFFLGTANADGQPYIQHRGGPPGFLRVLDEHTLGLADFSGNRQYLTQGNLQDNPKAFLFLVDYVNRRRFKLWGTAEVVEGDEALNARLAVPGYKARVEQAILFHLEAWDANCPQHIPQRFEAADVMTAIVLRDARIAELEAEVERLSQGGGSRPG